MQSSTPSQATRPSPSFDEFYQLHYRYVFTCVRNAYWGNDPADSYEDIVQDVFLAAWRKFDELRHDYVRAWLRGAARHAAYAYSRRKADLHHRLTLSLDAPLAYSGSDDVLKSLTDRIGVLADYDQQLEADELAENLRADDLRLLVMVADGFSMADIAMWLGTSPAAAQIRVARARDRAIGAIPAT